MPAEGLNQTYRAIPEAVTGYALNQFDWALVVPEGTSNLFNNPSFEASDISWVSGPAHSVARQTSDAIFGLYSLLATDLNNGNTKQLFFTTTNVPNNTGYVTFSFYFKCTTASISFSVGSGQLGVYKGPTVSFTSTGQWQRVSYTTQYSDMYVTGGQAYFYVQNNTSQALNFSLDALQLEAKPYSTTYCDGTQANCNWAGVAHASISYRPNYTFGGREYRLADLGFLVTAVSGLDAPPYSAEVQEYGYIGGQQYIRTVPKPQIITLSNIIQGSTYPVTRAAKDKIVGLLAPFASQYKDRFLILRGKPVQDCLSNNLTQIGPTLELFVRLQGDLSGTNDNYNQERFALSFVSDTPPATRDSYEKALNLSVFSINAAPQQRQSYYKATIPQRNNVASTLNQWTLPSVAGQITSLLVQPNNYTYDSVTADAANGFAAVWNGTSGFIASLPNLANSFATTNNIINSIVADGSGNIYVGGNFTTPRSFIMKVSPPSGANAAVGTTNVPNAQVRALLYDPVGAQLFAFGDFTNSGTRWGVLSGSTWTNPTGGAGFNNTVRGALKIQNGSYVIWGDFTSVDGTPYNRIVQYNINGTFKAIGAGLNGPIYSVVQLPTGELVIGGNFTATGTGLICTYTAIYNGSTIQPLGNNSLGAQVNSVAYFGGRTYAAFAANTAVDINGNQQVFGGFAQLVGDIWQPLDIIVSVSTGGDFIGGALGALYTSTSSGSIGGSTLAAAVNSIPYKGTADAYPTVIVRAPGGIVNIVNQATGRGLYFYYNALSTGEYWTIQFSPTGVTATSNLNGDVTRYIAACSDFTGWALTRRNTSDAASIDYNSQIAVLSSGTVELYWRTIYQGFSASATADFVGL